MADVVQVTAAMLDDYAETAAAAAARARRAAIAAVFVLLCATAVLAIDHGIKREILDEAKRLRDALDEAGAAVLAVTAQKAAKEATPGEPSAGKDSGTPGAGADLDSGGAVGADTGTRAAANGDAQPRRRAAPGGPRSGRAGARRDG